MVQGYAESTATNAAEVEWVTLVSKDDYHFVIDKRFALQSVFIRSMLGGGGPSGDNAQRSSKPQNAAETNGGAGTTARATMSSTAQESASQTRMREHATPPPGGSAAAATRHGDATAGGASDPDGYVNPFAASATQDADDDARAFNSFEAGFAEAQSNVVRLPNIRGQVLETVVEYLCWNAKYSGAKVGDIPDFEYRIPPEIALEVLMAADYLNEA